MRAERHSTTPSLEWMDPKVREPRYELHAGDEVIARLTLEPLCRTFATAETRAGTWTFKQVGILASLVHIRELGAGEDLAVFHPGFLGRGTLTFGDGETFYWRPDHHRGAWSFRDWDGKAVLTLRLEPAPPGEPWPHRTKAEVEIPPERRAGPRLPLLTAFGWYLIALRQ